MSKEFTLDLDTQTYVKENQKEFVKYHAVIKDQKIQQKEEKEEENYLKKKKRNKKKLKIQKKKKKN